MGLACLSKKRNYQSIFYSETISRFNGFECLLIAVFLPLDLCYSIQTNAYGKKY